MAGRGQAPAQPLLAAVGRCLAGRPFPGPPRCDSVKKKERKTTRVNRSFSRGLCEELVTPVNSAEKDPFVRV